MVGMLVSRASLSFALILLIVFRRQGIQNSDLHAKYHPVNAFYSAYLL